MILNRSYKNNLKYITFALAITFLLLSVWFVLARPAIPQTKVSSGQTEVLSAKVDKQTMGLLKQTALHMSKLNGGESVGGFPKFEPPKDDKDYKEKIKNRDYSSQDVNDWVKEINNFFQQIIKKNPNMTLEQILQKAGLTSVQIEDFAFKLRIVYVIAQSGQGHGVSETTVKTLGIIMQQLGVTPW